MTFDEHREALITYLKSKADLADWHAVSDAANDLRELEARQKVLMAMGITQSFDCDSLS
jgi:hypothetical protein